jgi:hypothetical protein
MNSMMSVLMIWPGTSTGNPGKYGVTNIAKTTSWPSWTRSSTSGWVR